MKKFFLVFLILCMGIVISACDTGSPISFDDETFSYEKILEEYENALGVQTSGFQNTTVKKINDKTDALERAKNECTVDYDEAMVFYDEKADMWMVEFYKRNVAGGDQCVFLNGSGITCLIIYGE